MVTATTDLESQDLQKENLLSLFAEYLTYRFSAWPSLSLPFGIPDWVIEEISKQGADKQCPIQWQPAHQSCRDGLV